MPKKKIIPPGNPTRLQWILLVLFFAKNLANSASELALTDKTSIKFADAKNAAIELQRPDVFVKALSPFDRAARKKTDQPVSEEEFLRFVSTQALSWEGGEIDKLTRAIGSVSNKLTGLSLNLPASILLVKTTGHEEGEAAYCRGNNIILPAQRLAASAQSLERLLTHELFHILSRNNRKLRDSLYAIVGFRPCGAVAFPRELAPRKLTNPDAPVIEHSITVTNQGAAIRVVPILFSSTENYDVKKGGEFFAYLTFKLMAIEKRGTDWMPAHQQSNLILLDAAELPSFRDQIGENTDYIIHPEEILADNFVLLVFADKEVRTPRIVNEMRRVLAAAER